MQSAAAPPLREAGDLLPVLGFNCTARSQPTATHAGDVRQRQVVRRGLKAHPACRAELHLRDGRSDGGEVVRAAGRTCREELHGRDAPFQDRHHIAHGGHAWKERDAELHQVVQQCRGHAGRIWIARGA